MNNAIRPINETIAGTTNTGRTGPGNNDNEEYCTFPDAQFLFKENLLGEISILNVSEWGWCTNSIPCREGKISQK